MRPYNEEFVGFHEYAIGAQIVRRQIQFIFWRKPYANLFAEILDVIYGQSRPAKSKSAAEKLDHFSKSSKDVKNKDKMKVVSPLT